MKSVIPFTKELEFDTKLSEITSISLERDFEVQKESIEGDLYVTGEYKSHEISVNVIPFSFKIPFSIAIPSNVVEDSISLEISDFAYDTLEDNKIKVHIELELSFLEEEKCDVSQDVVDESDSIISMMEERSSMDDGSGIEEVKEEVVEDREEQLDEVVDDKTSVVEEVKEEDRSEDSEMITETDVILKSNAKEEYMTYHIHIVKEGENLESICAQYHVTGSFLAEYNDITNINVGDKILVPLENE